MSSCFKAIQAILFLLFSCQNNPQFKHEAIKLIQQSVQSENHNIQSEEDERKKQRDKENEELLLLTIFCIFSKVCKV